MVFILFLGGELPPVPVSGGVQSHVVLFHYMINKTQFLF